MSLWRRERICIGIGADSISLFNPSSCEMRQLDISMDADTPDNSSRLAEALTALIADQMLPPKALYSVVVADSLAKYWMMYPTTMVNSFAELRAVASARCEQLFGRASPWHVVGDWHAQRPFLCAALPQWVINASQSAFGHNVSLQAALPMMLSDVIDIPADSAWLCVTFPGRITLLAGSGGRISSIRTMYAQHLTDMSTILSEAAQELRRECLRTQIPLGALVHWCQLGGESPQSMALEKQDFGGLRFACLRTSGRTVAIRHAEVVRTEADAAAVLATLI